MLLFAPNLWWNATHGWETFAFQFGRVEGEAFTLRYLFEFLGAQLVLATPFILVLGVMGLADATRARDERLMLIAAILWPAIIYFAYHSLHDRVQGNWPCFLYPLLSVAAALALAADGLVGLARAARALVEASCRSRSPAVLLAAAYAQALFGVVPMGRKDPLARLLGGGLSRGDARRWRRCAARRMPTRS